MYTLTLKKINKTVQLTNTSNTVNLNSNRLTYQLKHVRSTINIQANAKRGLTGPRGLPGEVLVESVNGKQGAVVLDANDVGADSSGEAASALVSANAYTDTQIAAIDFPVDSVNGRTGPITLSKSDVGLSNVDNTSDLSKPISTDTQTALNTKEPSIPTGTSSQYIRGDKTLATLDKSAVGLSNVDNTSDLGKPISTSTQSALDLKESLSNKSTSTSLGSSDTLYPTQNAVKSYVDTGLAAKVTGAASSTDNAVARFDATTGKIIQNSLVTIDDTGNIAGGISLTMTSGAILDRVSSQSRIRSSSGTDMYVTNNSNLGLQIANTAGAMTITSPTVNMTAGNPTASPFTIATSGTTSTTSITAITGSYVDTGVTPTNDIASIIRVAVAGVMRKAGTSVWTNDDTGARHTAGVLGGGQLDAGSMTSLVGVRARSTSLAAGTSTNVMGFYAYDTSLAGTHTNHYGFFAENPTVSGTVTNNYGVYIRTQSSGSTVNVGLGFQSGTTVASGIQWGSDTNLYRSAAGMLKSDGQLTMGNYALTTAVVHFQGGSGGNSIMAFSRGSGTVAANRFDFNIAGGGFGISEALTTGRLVLNAFADAGSSRLTIGQEGSIGNYSAQIATLSASTHATGAGSNIGGPNLIIQGGGGTGTGTPGDIQFKTFSTTTAGATVQTSTVRATISANTGKFTLSGDTLNIATTKTPASAAATGVTGDHAWDSNYIYVCVATNTWKRAALTTW